MKKKSVQRPHELEADIKKIENTHSAQSDHSILLEREEQSSSTLKSIIPGIQNDRDELKTDDI